MNLTKINGQNVQVDELNLPLGLSLGTSPNLPLVEGNLAYNLTDNKVYVCDGSVWNVVASASGGTITTTGITFTNSTPSYTPSALNYYEVVTASYAMSGCCNVTFNCTWTRIGNLVNLSWLTSGSGFGTATTIAGRLTTSATVPARFLKANQTSSIIIMAGALSISIAHGDIYFLSGGTIEICNIGNTDFAFPGYAGFTAGSMTYAV